MTERTCSVDGCGRKHKGHGLCASHLTAARERGDFGGDPCSAHGCERVAVVRGLCTLHHQRWLAHGDPMAQVKPYRVVEPCTMDGCTDSHFGKGLCRRHYFKLHKYGDPLALRVPMGVRCQVCDHADATRIDELLRSQAMPCAQIARMHGMGSKKSIYIHRDRHLDNPEWHAKRAAWWIAELSGLEASATT